MKPVKLLFIVKLLNKSRIVKKRNSKIEKSALKKLNEIYMRKEPSCANLNIHSMFILSCLFLHRNLAAMEQLLTIQSMER